MNLKWIFVPIIIIGASGTALAIYNRYYETFQTEGSLTLEILDGHTFKNEYNPRLTSPLPPGYYEKVLKQAQDIGCVGGDAVTTITSDKESVTNCFQKNDNSDATGGKIYASIKTHITSITFDDLHLCTASYRGGSKWITAGHCFENQRPPYTHYKLLLDKPYPITVRLCESQNCDIAVVEPIGAPPSAARIVPMDFALTTISSTTTLFIPGIEVGTSIPEKNIDGAGKKMMWSKIQNACIPYEVKRGCISYTCSTLKGFSGAPVFSVRGAEIRLIGVHAGGQVGGSCENNGINSAVTSDIFKRMVE